MRFEVAPFDFRIPVDVTVHSGKDGTKKLEAIAVESEVQKTTAVELEVVTQPVLEEVATAVEMALVAAAEESATEQSATEPVPMKPPAESMAALKVDTEPVNARPSLELQLRKGESLRLAVDYFVRHQHARLLAPTLTDSLLKLVDAALIQREKEMETELQRQLDAVTEEQRERRKQRMLQRYKICFPESYQGEEERRLDFATILPALIQVNDRAFDIVLQLEQCYQAQVGSMINARNAEVAELRAKHESAVESIAGPDGRRKNEVVLLGIPERQAEEMDALCSQWHQNIKEVKRNQKAEFRQRVLELHAMLERKEAYEAAWITELTQPSKAIDSTMISPTESLYAIQPDPVVERKVAELLEMGFTAEQARASLNLSQQDMDRAIVLLLEDPEHVALAVEQGFGQSVMVRQNSNFTSPTSSTTSPASSRGNGWSPFNFIEQKISNNPSAKSNLKKIGSWIDKAKAQIEEIIETDPVLGKLDGGGKDYRNFNESFTISMGSQVRYSQNLRLMVSRNFDLYAPPDLDSQLAVRAQSYATLSSNKLTAMVLLLTPEDWVGYKFGHTANKELFRQCYESPELYFEDVETQLTNMENDLLVGNKGLVDMDKGVADMDKGVTDKEAGPSKVEEGDVFITKHTNLPLVHVVFHLVISSNSKTITAHWINAVALHSELTQRSTVMRGLRHILLTSFQGDIRQVSIPLLLTSDDAKLPTVPVTAGSSNPKQLQRKQTLGRSTSFPSLAMLTGANSPTTPSTIEQDDFSVVYKRADTLLKCTRGYLLECARLFGKYPGPGLSLSAATEDMPYSFENATAVQFVVPHFAATEDSFRTLKNMLRSTYRVT